MPFLVGFSGGWGFPFYSAAAFPHPPTIIAPKTPHFSLARDVPKPRDADTKTKTYFLVVFHWSHAVPCPKSQGMLTKRVFWGSWVFFGWDGDSFPFYSGPMLSHVPKTKGCRQKDSKLGIFVESFPFYSGPMLSHVPKPKDFFQAGYLGVSTKLSILGQLGILE